MNSPLGLVWAVGEILLLAFGIGVLSAVGLYFELLAVSAVTTGQLTFGLWLSLCGGVALYFGVYAMGLTELLPRLRVVTRRAGRRLLARR